MRRQYFFRPSDHGFDAWDIHHLIELSAKLPVKEVALSSITEIDSTYWFGADGTPATVRTLVRHMELVNAADISYPVILGADGQVMDGMHRIARSLLEGRATIGAVQFDEQPDPDYTNVTPDDLSYD